MAPSTMKAIVTNGDGTVQLKDVPVPKPKPTEILVKIVAAAQNPSDWKSIGRQKESDLVVGCDFAGIVEEIGSEVAEGARKIGERVAGLVHGSYHKDRGAFAEYLVTDGELVISLPDNLSFEDAATLGVAGFTTCQMMWQSQSLASPANPVTVPTPILVWSGASAVGITAIQVAKASGYTVVTTASEKNHAYLKSIGADIVYDYKDENVGHKIREYTKGELVHALDCISELDTPKKVSASLSPSGGTVSILIPYKPDREEVKTVLSRGYTLFGEPLTFPVKLPALPEHKVAHKEYAKILSKLLSEGKLKTPPLKIMPNGLESVKEGVEFQKSGKVSAQKLVYLIADTLKNATA